MFWCFIFIYRNESSWWNNLWFSSNISNIIKRKYLSRFSTNKTISSKKKDFHLKNNFLFSFIEKNALTLGIAFFDLPAFFIGILIDRFGCRFVKLISM